MGSLLQINNITGGYTKTPVLKDVSFDVNAGELVGLIGLNGAGKSTTIKHIIGLMEAKKEVYPLIIKPFNKTQQVIEVSLRLFQKLLCYTMN